MTDLVTCVGLAQSPVSAHLSCLRDCGWSPPAPRAGPPGTSWPARSCWTCWPPPSSCSPRRARRLACAPPTAPAPPR
ncbi:hypothetical protein [Streptomyces albogriseolus]|uniref:hypothetical protein n=1 Tax=Streptomyces albogriseolus TaxID=1887 RepID=UPI00345F851D